MKINLRLSICQAMTYGCAILSVSSVARAQNLVLNGSFEAGAFSGDYFGNTFLDAGSTAITAWTVIDSDILWLTNDASDSIVFNVSASDGERFLDLTGFDNLPFGGVEQAVPTQIGRRYRLAFDLGTNPARLGATQTLMAQVGSDQTTFTFTGTGDSSQYRRYGLDFVANSSSTLISFIGSTPSGGHIGLDNVVVSQVPEPASWLAMAIGVVLVAHFRLSNGGAASLRADPGASFAAYATVPQPSNHS
jgi:hypothetical protein